MALHAFFPTVVAHLTNYTAAMIENEQLLNAEYEKRPQGHLVSKDTYILDKTPLLKGWIEEQLNGYTSEVLATTKKLRITQSWCIKTEGIPQKLFVHRHPNSIVSGSYYIAAPKGTQGITFYKHTDVHADCPYVVYEPNKDISDKPWLFNKATFPVQTNEMYLFPSHLSHGVEDTGNLNLRCVLAFNTWFEDSIGDPHQLTEVKF